MNPEAGKTEGGLNKQFQREALFKSQIEGIVSAC